MLRRTALLASTLAILLAACSQASIPASVPPAGLELFSAPDFSARLAASERPAVVNVWASWCIPCRSEAPLFVTADRQFGDRVDFLGVAINDTDADARAFLAEFGITYENLLDPSEEVRKVLPGSGVPMTYFIAPGGEVISTHFGVIDDQALALGIDELLRRG